MNVYENISCYFFNYIISSIGYTVYRSEIVYNGENRDYYLTYYIICFF